jgi:hypothetical protein
MYHDVQNVDQLNNVFSSIALNLAPRINHERRGAPGLRDVMVAGTLTKGPRIFPVS